MKKTITFCFILMNVLCIHSEVRILVNQESVLNSQSESEVFENVGKGIWKDCFFADSGEKEVFFERSVSHMGVFRVTPYNYTTNDTPILIHTEDPSRIWLEPFNAKGYKFTQQCSENGRNSSKYGNMINGRIEIPSEYFSITKISTGQTTTVSEKILVIILPESNYKDSNGIFMGIISFNDKLDNLPITNLNGDTKPEFMDFVNNMEMGNATLLYYAVDQAITTLSQPEYPENLTNAMIITFTDGLDQGSLAMAPEHLTSRNYAQYLSNRISSTQIHGLPLQAYTIGLKSEDVADDDLFMLNLEALASDSTKKQTVTDIEGVQEELTRIYEELNQQTSQRIFSITVPMMSHNDIYRFTLDYTVDADKVNDSKMWIEGVFNIADNSLNNLTYHGLTSSSGNKITAERNGVYITFTFNDCRDEDGQILEIEKNGIDQWTYISSNNTWQHNVENDKDGKINIEDIHTSAAIMFVLDSSRSLGDLFPILKQTANSFIAQLAGGNNDNTNGIGIVYVDNQKKKGIYTLNGVKLNTSNLSDLSKGIYIVNGKKVIVK